MLAPPSAQSFSDALQTDPSMALKGRGFSQSANKRVQSRPSAVGALADIGSMWTESPAEREKRLMEEELGLRSKGDEQAGPDEEEQEMLRKEREREQNIARAIQEHVRSSGERGKETCAQTPPVERV